MLPNELFELGMTVNANKTDSGLKENSVTSKCPECDSTIPIWQRIFFSDTVGLECGNCHSVFKHSKKTKYLKAIVFALFLILLAIFAGFKFGVLLNAAIFSLLFLIACAIIFIQLNATFITVYNTRTPRNPDKSKKAKSQKH